MNWWNVLENFIGDGLSNLIIGGIIAFFIARYAEKVSEKRNMVSSLVMLDSEAQYNKHVIESVLENGIKAFEFQYKKGEKNQIEVSPDIFEDAAKFLNISIEGLQKYAFLNSHQHLTYMKNTKLYEEIVNLYEVSINEIQRSFKMGQLNWYLIDAIKKRLTKEIIVMKKMIIDLKKEIKKEKFTNPLLETLKFR